MDFTDYSAGKSPRRELQGPRPTPLRVRKDSHKIKKPPVAPQPSQQPPTQPRPPVIIYTVSPKVIHANPNEFMTLVQRLTGPDHSTTCSSSDHHSASSSSFQDFSHGAVSPAARFASIEKTKSPPGKKLPNIYENDEMDVFQGVSTHELERSNIGLFPGILSPNPASLQPIPSNFFSPPSDHQNPLGFLYDLSPVVQNNKSYLEGSFFYSPSTFISPRIGSPNTQNLDLFNNLFD